MKKRVLVLDPVDQAGTSLLNRDDIECVHLPFPSDDEIRSELAQADALVLRAREIPKEWYLEAKKLQLISRHGVGCDNLDLNFLDSIGIGVAIAADANAVSVAEHTMMLMLSVSRATIKYDQSVRNDAWAFRDSMVAQDLYQRSLVIVGFGRIGQHVAARAHAFGMQISIYDPALPSDVTLPEYVSRVESIEQAVSIADILSLHLPRTVKTENLFSKELLSQVKPGCLIVNAARGGIVNESDLIEKLDDKTVIGYATDVFNIEPPAPKDPLFSRDDVTLSPHSAAMTVQGSRRMATRSCQNVLDFFDGKLTQDMIVVNPSPEKKRNETLTPCT